MKLSMRVLTLLFVLFLCTCVRAQTLTGRITDAETGEPLPFASIYVQQTQSGTASNADGDFQVRLAAGSNTVIFQYLGYQTQVKTVLGNTRLDIKLISEALELDEVEILSGGEDRSYSVIRRAIAKADYHRNQLDAYTAQVYIKGTGKVNKIPGLLRMMASKEDRKEIDEALNRAYTSESTSEVSYTRPNTYAQKVISKYEIGDAEFDAAQYIFTSFYDPLVADAIVSPLNPKAFGYYKFELEGVFVDRDELVNKIRVIPRSRGEDVFEGYINIVHDDWSIHSLELTTYKLGFQIDIGQTFAEVQDHVWMPITTTLDANGQIFGIAFEYHYLSTVSNYVLSLNTKLGGYVEVIDEKTQPEVAERTPKAREVSDLERTLAEGGEIKAKDLRKLMREYEKEERKASEAPEVESNYSFSNDSVVVVRDTAAWAQLRPVPLTAEEVIGYAIADGLERNKKLDSLEVTVGKDGSRDTVTLDSAALAKRNLGRFRLDNWFPDPIFNPVEGYALGTRLGWINRKKAIGFGVHPRYGIGWKRLIVEGDVQLGRSGVSNTPKIRLSGGRFLRQFNDQPAIDPWISAYNNLVSGGNFIRLYERVYGQLDYTKKYSDALRADARLAYEERRAVTNSSNNNWWGLSEGESYAPNTPLNAARGFVSEVNPAATARFGLAWRPGLKYEIENGRKRVIDLSAPTISFRLAQGLPEIGASTADFTQLEAAYEHRFDVGRKGRVDLLVRGGAFVNNQSVDFPDFKHFATSELILTSLDPIGSYRLLPYYAESTNEEYLEFYGHYQFRKFLLTRIWKLHLMGLKEDLFVNYLHTPTSEHYTEVGYSIDNILRIFRLEFVTAFRDLEYADFGVRFSISTTIMRDFN
ncbi:DUF5686 and carboxypeptidase regulatory-like domain-containing protein [Neolewinella lacunae]|uniref:Carboxypeptidase-like regulatory domain-containing protein n=1 Tax=Neolewinella lacunae TaxID=1517758 RepID=A0A923TAA7_9BACT|nr:DUF5686 and carboxypeptidase regulatory-like domain-containing protein [Neolewinella lacunae]MBC6996339.1 carboxypeptidase-like regulatory domain-containing protein [Neolewinella lacunae]MDN3636962.1 DUF5686 and carboxypeptidase regulatory-like domain-containing protein [Neolewinella lacunae]